MVMSLSRNQEFSYSLDAENGPTHWGEIKEERSACGEGEMQSPIDLASPHVSLVSHLRHLNHSYAPANAFVVNRGHDIMVHFEGDVGSVFIDYTAYHLRQLHWHAPTEHSVNGRRYDMELYMVHQSAKNKTAVIGVFYEIGARDAFQHKLEPYLEMIAKQPEREEKVGVVDARSARGRASMYYRYVGSLTTPPCTQGVIWTIVKRVHTVSRHQLELLREAVHDEMEKNARPRQEVKIRDISRFWPIQQNKH
ncbi:alpha carbonic anhydrase 7-like [Triticum dicoccoides]|uniref:alpha carbonic anhydrase 7-like n=1 Tax=Triticum dicoccoides TaxID=85692 RepID=UPI001891E984|nr:alpha carbonic anhydrase 7-like [Triticum dicoccoides]